MSTQKHELADILHGTVSLPWPRSQATWTCQCGATGNTSAAFIGEDLEAKAKRNHGQHRRRANAKEQK